MTITIYRLTYPVAQYIVVRIFLTRSCVFKVYREMSAKELTELSEPQCDTHLPKTVAELCYLHLALLQKDIHINYT